MSSLATVTVDGDDGLSLAHDMIDVHGGRQLPVLRGTTSVPQRSLDKGHRPGIGFGCSE
jgi:hypothetical protein